MSEGSETRERDGSFTAGRGRRDTFLSSVPGKRELGAPARLKRRRAGRATEGGGREVEADREQVGVVNTPISGLADRTADKQPVCQVWRAGGGRQTSTTE